MVNEDNYAERIIDELSILNSNKLSSNESTIYFSGMLYSIILNKNIFKKNSDLRDFIYYFFLQPFHMEQYKDYLYKSRTLLGSRVSRHILDNFNYSDTIMAAKLTSKYIMQNYNISKHSNSRYEAKSLAKELSGWISHE